MTESSITMPPPMLAKRLRRFRIGRTVASNAPLLAAGATGVLYGYDSLFIVAWLAVWLGMRETPGKVWDRFFLWTLSARTEATKSEYDWASEICQYRPRLYAVLTARMPHGWLSERAVGALWFECLAAEEKERQEELQESRTRLAQAVDKRRQRSTGE